MKKTITVRLCVVIVVSMMAAVVMNYYLQIKAAKEAMEANSMIRINEIAQILERNDGDVKQLKESLKEDYFIRAKAAAYIIQNNPEASGDLEELRKIAALLQVDELHLFDPEGTLFSGSEPKYYNYTFSSGEQMQFFLPMLDDYSLQLCQDVTPNTAEGKMMQYIAVWREDHKGIIQIGMEPVRLLEAMRKNELSYIFSMVTTDSGITAFAADPDTGEILGATREALVGERLKDLGIDWKGGLPENDVTSGEGVFDGEKNYCVVRPAGDVLVGISSTYGKLYNSIPDNMMLVVMSLCVLAVVIIVLILRMLDRFIIRDIHKIIGGLQKIAGGDLDARVKVTSTPEFVQLSSNINHMVESLLETTGKLSLVFENVNIPIAVYEYSRDMKRVLATSKLGEILGMGQQEALISLSDYHIFSERIKLICSQPMEGEKDVYRIRQEKERFVKIKSYEEENKMLGILVDVTEEKEEKRKIEKERDVDVLTGLHSRRAFFAAMDQLFLEPGKLRAAMILMMDLDKLKYVNDTWGHRYGDLILQKAAELVKNCAAPQKLAARLSGDEFVLVIYGAESRAEIKGYLDRLETVMKQTFMELPGGQRIPVSLSGGYVFFEGNETDYSEMLQMADHAMYHVKKGSRGRFEEYRPPVIVDQ